MITSIETRTQEIAVADGTRMNLYIASPRDAKACPAIIVLQEAFGVNQHIRNVTERIAREGYLAIAPELFHRTARDFEGSYTDFPAVMPHYQAVTVERLQADFRATHEWLNAQPNWERGKVASIGFCMGGRASYVANATLPLRAAISFYGGGIAPNLLPMAKQQHGPILMIWGGKDKHIPLTQTRAIADALSEAGKPFIDIVFSEADHAFSNDDRPIYHEKSTKEAWALSYQFLRGNL